MYNGQHVTTYINEMINIEEYTHSKYIKEALIELFNELEFSDEHIISSGWNEFNMDHPNVDNSELMRGFIIGCKWYRKQIKEINADCVIVN